MRQVFIEIVAHLQERFAPVAGGAQGSRAEALLEEQCGLLREILDAVRGRGDAGGEPR